MGRDTKTQPKRPTGETSDTNSQESTQPKQPDDEKIDTKSQRLDENMCTDSKEPAQPKHLKTVKDSQERTHQPEQIHKFRTLIGLPPYRLERLAYGWEVDSAEPQRVLDKRRRAAELEQKVAKQRAMGEIARLRAKEKHEQEVKERELAAVVKRKADEEYERNLLQAELRRKTGVRVHGWKEDERTDELWAKAKVYHQPAKRPR